MSQPIWYHNSVRETRSAEITRWLGASLTVLAVHASAIAWLMHKPASTMADAAPPAAIMIEFADAAEAIDTQMDQISPDQQDADQQAPTEDVRQEPVDPVEDVPEKQIEEEVTQEQAEPPEQEVVIQPDQVAVPLPTAQPNPPPQQQEIQPEQPRPQQASSQASLQAQAQVQQSNRMVAPQTASSSPTPAQTARWQSRLMAHLERRKRYPSSARARNERGTVHVRFTIDDEGNVLSVALARSSGYAELDNEVLSLVRRASPVPAPPPDVKRSITAPVRFDVK